MHQIENTLYVMTQGAYAHLENDTVRIDVEREKRLQVPLHHVGALVCFGNVLVSPFLIHRCAEEGKAVVLLSQGGRFKARIEGPVSGNILLRQAQYRGAADPKWCLGIARAMIAGKIKNSRQILMRGAREAAAEKDSTALGVTAEQLANALRRVPHAANLDELRGIEGESAKNYFGAVSLLLRTDARGVFALDGRTRRPPRDRINALLSFLYAMLMNDCRSAVEATGLDPQLGFLHAVRPGRASLALDLMEELRAWAADRLALTLINRGQIQSTDFDEHEGGAVLLNEKGRKAVVVAYQERKQEAVMHPLLEKTVPIGVIPFLQARYLARTLRGDMEGYLPFVVR